MEYDLTPTVCRWLDDHFIVQILDFAEISQSYNPKDIIKAKLDVLSKTKMLDFARGQREKAIELGISGVEPLTDEEGDKQRVYEEIQSLKAACGPLLAVIEDEALLSQLQQEQQFNLPHLSLHYGVTEEHVDNFRKYARIYYDIGQYTNAATWLKLFRQLTSDPEKRYWALWGQLAGNLSSLNIQGAIDDFQALKHQIDQRNDDGTADQLTSLHHRTWFVHWSLFLYEDESGREAMIKLLTGDDRRPDDRGFKFTTDHRMINAIQTQSPHILRYLSAAILLQSSNNYQVRRRLIRELLRILRQTPEYKDPMTEFVRALYIDFDFEAAQQNLKGVFKLTATDFFLHWVADELRNTCRQLLFESFCRINRSGDIDVLAKHLGIDEEQQRVEHEQREKMKKVGSEGEEKEADAEAEEEETPFQPKEVQPQLVEFIKASQVRAKIDSSINRLIIGSYTQTLPHSVMVKTRSLLERTSSLAAHLEKKYNDQGLGP